MRVLMPYLKGKGVWSRADISSVESPSDSVAHYIAFETGIIGQMSKKLFSVNTLLEHFALSSIKTFYSK